LFLVFNSNMIDVVVINWPVCPWLNFQTRIKSHPAFLLGIWCRKLLLSLLTPTVAPFLPFEIILPSIKVPFDSKQLLKFSQFWVLLLNSWIGVNLQVLIWFFSYFIINLSFLEKLIIIETFITPLILLYIILLFRQHFSLSTIV
jgi:hypothetical protein